MESVAEDQPCISGPEDIHTFVRMQLGPMTKECVYALYLDSANRIVHHGEVNSGTVDKTAIYPREIIKPAIAHDATGVVLVHNHIAELPVPSEQDLALTKKLEDIALPLGIKLIDHLIVTRLKAYSLKTGKLL